VRSLPLTKQIAARRTACNLCPYEIAPGEIFWQVISESGRQTITICTCHIPLNVTGMHSEADSNIAGATNVWPDALDVRRDIIPKLLTAWDEVYNLSAEWFEELIFDRLIAMGLQPIRLGAANRKDGGIDIIFWSCGLFPMLGAVQVKHHRTPDKKTDSQTVRDLVAGMRSYHFNVGLVISNTSFTRDAKFESEKSGSPPIQLRDGQALRKWIADDFEIEEIDSAVRTIEVCKGFGIDIPKFR
jgi:hypothetical protein